MIIKTKLVLHDDTLGMHVIEFEGDIRQNAEKLGYTFAGVETSPMRRPELRGLPRFRELLGPMWDGGVIRYEDQKVYDLMSV